MLFEKLKDQSHIQHSYTNQYDMRSQLTYSRITNVGGLDWASDTYSYDKAGNVKSHICANSVPATSTTNYGFDNTDLMYSAFSNDGGDNLDNEWDKNGNLKTKVDEATTTLVYNWDGKLRSATQGPNSISIKYDPMGNRVYKNSSVQGIRKYVIDVASGLPTILVETGSSLIKAYYYANGEILAHNNNGNYYFYLHDRLGSVRAVIYKSGTNFLVANNYSYTPFGELIATESTETIENHFKFTGQYYDSEIGQYYLRARQYDPQLMRLTGRDPVNGDYEEPMTLHKYLYCFNNPINNIDPTGENTYAEEDEVMYGGSTMLEMGTNALGVLALAYLVVDAANIRGAALEMLTYADDLGDRIWDLGAGVMALAANYANDAVDRFKGGKIKDRDKWPYEVKNKPDFNKFKKWFDRIWKPKSKMKSPTEEDIIEAYKEFEQLWRNTKI